MRRSFTFTVCAALLAFLSATTVKADDIDITLEWSPGGTWELFAEVTGSGGVDGSDGISAVRALIDGIDFGTGGDAVTIASGIGAINPVNGGPPVLDLGGGVIEVLYGQDISDFGSVVLGVGTSSRALLASGTGDFSGGAPSFGMDGSLSSQGLFLSNNTDPLAAAVDPDTSETFVVEVGGIQGDLNMDGFVDGLDLGILLGSFNQNATPENGELNGTDPVDGLDLGILLGAWNPPGALGAASVPEPTSLALLALAGTALMATRRGRC